MMNKTRRKKLDTVLTYVILIILAAFIVVPVLWMLSTAFKTEAQTYYPNPKWLPDPFSLESFHKFFSTYNFGKMTVNAHGIQSNLVPRTIVGSVWQPWSSVWPAPVWQDMGSHGSNSRDVSSF